MERQIAPTAKKQAASKSKSKEERCINKYVVGDKKAWKKVKKILEKVRKGIRQKMEELKRDMKEEQKINKKLTEEKKWIEEKK